MKRFFKCLAAAFLLAQILTPLAGRAAEKPLFRPPAVPLVACDPYFSIWSQGDKLTDTDTTHWTGKPHRLTSLARIDGKTFRLMGKEPARLEALPQVSLEVLPTRTIYAFEGQGVRLEMTFMTPALPDDLDLLSRPVTYVTWEARSLDGKKREVAVYLDANSEIAVNTPDQPVAWSEETISGLLAMRVGSVEQPVLQKRGDDLRIDWGYLYLAAASSQKPLSQLSIQTVFDKSGASSPKNSPQVPAFAFNLGKVGSKPVARWMMLAYDDLYSIQYMKKNLRPYWRRNGWEAADLLKASAKEYPALVKRCAAFDKELIADLTKAGGEAYAQLGSLAYRQCFAAGKFVADDKGQPLSFCKENHSNGCIGTSDVFYPMAPQFLLFGPSLAKSFLVPFMDYAASDRWKFPFAPHDLGTYPMANGQVYGGGERTEENQMPVEESGNLLLLITAVAEMEGNADFAGRYWPQLSRWADYLKDKGFDPENQLCTDDFAGHLAHNVNLSAKAICGLKAFAKLCAMRGENDKAAEFSKIAKEFAARWLKEASEGDHFRLAFDRPGSWSQKYNLVWDRVLGLNLFPAEALRKEMDFYLKTQNKYGLPLDNRQTYTKLDWILWTATLTQDPKDFSALLNPVIRFLNETPDRSPMTDWYQTVSGKKVGFTARPVVGGVFMQLLYDRGTWQKWAKRDKTKAAGWALMPKAPVAKVVVATAREEEAIRWRYTTEKPGEDWVKAGFNAVAWKEGPAGFGTRGTPGGVIRTEWKTPDIWLRREFTLPAQVNTKNLQLWIHHDEDAEVYINGILAARVGGFVGDYTEAPISKAAAAGLKPGPNTLSVHCHQTTGGQYIDVGFAELVP